MNAIRFFLALSCAAGLQELNTERTVIAEGSGGVRAVRPDLRFAVQAFICPYAANDRKEFRWSRKRRSLSSRYGRRCAIGCRWDAGYALQFDDAELPYNTEIQDHSAFIGNRPPSPPCADRSRRLATEFAGRLIDGTKRVQFPLQVKS